MKKQEKKIAILKKIAHQFNEVGIVWALGASMFLYFKGIASDFHDIDLMIANEDADCVRDILIKMGHIEPSKPDPRYKTKLFMEFVVEDVDIDVMVGLAIVHDNEVVDCSLKKDQIEEIIDVDGENIPVQSVKLWCEYYRLMGRTDKVKMIQNALAKNFSLMNYPLRKE